METALYRPSWANMTKKTDRRNKANNRNAIFSLFVRFLNDYRLALAHPLLVWHQNLNLKCVCATNGVSGQI